MNSLIPSNQLFPEVDLLFKDLFSGSFFSTIRETNKINHPVDIVEDKDGNIFIEIAAVGANKEDFNIDVDDDILTVSYEKNKNYKADYTYLYKNITHKSFKFAWRIGRDHNLEKIEASLDKGLLNIKIPISEEKPKKQKKIELK